jgi:proteasome component ECM29
LHDLFFYFSFVDQAIGECNTRKVDDTLASKYRSISGSDDGLVFADFGFHTILYQTPSQGYILLTIPRKIINIILNSGG